MTLRTNLERVIERDAEQEPGDGSSLPSADFLTFNRMVNVGYLRKHAD